MRYPWLCCLISFLLGACATTDSGVAEATVESAPLHKARCHSSQSAGAPAPAPTPAVCLFGEQFRDIRTNDALIITSETWIRSSVDLTELEALQIVRAVQQSSHSDVTTAAEALSRVDQQEIRRLEFHDLASGRIFLALEYGAGDNSYGAFFERDAPGVVAAIHDGDLLECKVFAAGSAVG